MTNNIFTLNFTIFWALGVSIFIFLWVYEFRNKKRLEKFEKSAYFIFGAAMVGFAAFRPIGLSRDDLSYLEIYETICASLSCGTWIHGKRDFLWYSLVGLLKSFIPTPKIMLWMSASGLLVKLILIYKLVPRPFPVLLLYISIFYQIQDLTAWRVSLSISFLLLSIWFMSVKNNYFHSWLLILCGLFHKQGYSAPLILTGKYLTKHQLRYLLMCGFFLFLLLLGIQIPVRDFVVMMGSDFKDILVHNNLDVYFLSNIQTASTWPYSPKVAFPILLFLLWLSVSIKLDSEILESLLKGCLVMACLFLWLFSSLPVVQNRFFEFFIVPAVIFVGMRRLNFCEMIGAIIVSTIFFVKYNYLNEIFIKL